MTSDPWKQWLEQLNQLVSRVFLLFNLGVISIILFIMNCNFKAMMSSDTLARKTEMLQHIFSV